MQKIFKKTIKRKEEITMDKRLMNNEVELYGEITSNFQYSHEVFGEKFYKTFLLVKRLSGQKDILPLIVSERLMDVKEDYKGQYIEVEGQLRSYNIKEKEKSRLMLYVFAGEVEFTGDVNKEMSNYIFLDGYICKPPIYRKTPLGREIADLLLAVNRTYGKSDYIPCICWGRNARFAEKFQVADHIQLGGRIQSREYQKKINEYETEKRVAYEVSVSRMEEKDESRKG